MGSFYTTLRSSLSALFSFSTAPPQPPQEEEAIATLEDVRARMVALASLCPKEAAEGLLRRIHYAPEVQTLWFMRSELMAVLARTFGEAAAREKVIGLGVEFRGLLPRSLQSRHSFLDSGGHSQWSEPAAK